jgi:hypothetical protein
LIFALNIYKVPNVYCMHIKVYLRIAYKFTSA